MDQPATASRLLSRLDSGLRVLGLGLPMSIVPLKKIEYGFGHIMIRSSFTPYSIYLRGTIAILIAQRAAYPEP